MLYAFWGEPPEAEEADADAEFEDGDFVIGDEISGQETFNIEDFYAQYRGPAASPAEEAAADDAERVPEAADAQP